MVITKLAEVHGDVAIRSLDQKGAAVIGRSVGEDEIAKLHPAVHEAEVPVVRCGSQRQAFGRARSLDCERLCLPIDENLGVDLASAPERQIQT